MRLIVADVTAGAIIDAKPLFGSTMAYGFASLERNVETNALPTIGLCENLAEAENDFRDRLNELWPQIASKSLRIAIGCRDFAAELKTLAEHYGPDQ